MKREELLDKTIIWFEEIAESAQYITTGNLSHEIATMRGKAIRCADFIKKHITDEHPKNPWISVKERLPKTDDDIIYLMNSGTPGRQDHYTKWFEEWLVMNATYWMPTQIPQKGGKV